MNMVKSLMKRIDLNLMIDDAVKSLKCPLQVLSQSVVTVSLTIGYKYVDGWMPQPLIW